MLARFDVIGSSTDRGTDGNGRLMEDVVDALDGALRDREIGEIAFEELDAGEVREVLALAGDQAVDDADLFAAANQFFCQVGSDEAGAAGDEV